MIADKNYHSPLHNIPKNEMKEKYYVINNITGKPKTTIRKLKTKASIRSNINFYRKEDYPIDVTFYEIGTNKKIAELRNKYAKGGYIIKWHRD